MASEKEFHKSLVVRAQAFDRKLQDVPPEEYDYEEWWYDNQQALCSAVVFGIMTRFNLQQWDPYIREHLTRAFGDSRASHDDAILHVLYSIRRQELWGKLWSHERRQLTELPPPCVLCLGGYEARAMEDPDFFEQFREYLRLEYEY